MEAVESPARDIPDPIKRQVRQRCGFGCVICGKPICEYEHMLGWANVHEHDPDEITLLCVDHHAQRTKNLLPIETVRQANSDPHNLKSGSSEPHWMFYGGHECTMVVGGNTFTSSALEFAAGVVIDQRAMVGFRLEDGHYLLTVALFDESNEPIVQIKDNWLAYSVEPWDIEFVGSKLTIRSGYRKIFIEILFEVPDKITLIRGRLLLNGVELYIRPTFIYVINSRQLIDHYSSDNVTVGLNLGEPLNVNVGVHLGNLPRYNIDREAAIRALRGKLEKMKGL